MLFVFHRLSRTGKTPSTPKECFQLLSRITQVFREEYIQKQDLAREQIEKRFVERHLIECIETWPPKEPPKKHQHTTVSVSETE